MNIISKSHFLKILKFRPKSLIGRQIIYHKIPQIIYDVSISGDNILLDKSSLGKEWYPVDEVEDHLIIDALPDDIYHTFYDGTILYYQQPRWKS